MAVAVSALSFGKGFFLPLVLAILISFLLAPVAGFLERLHFGRVPSVVLPAVMAFSGLVGLVYMMAGQR